MITYSQDFDVISNRPEKIDFFYHVFTYKNKDKTLSKYYASNVFDKKQAYFHFKKMLNKILLRID